MNWESRFDEVWAIWPVKKSKKVALKAWLKVKSQTDDQLEIIRSSIEMHNDLSQNWASGFIPHFSTWLNQERWDDEITKVKPEAVGRPNTSTWQPPEKKEPISSEEFMSRLKSDIESNPDGWLRAYAKTHKILEKINPSYNALVKSYIVEHYGRPRAVKLFREGLEKSLP